MTDSNDMEDPQAGEVLPPMLLEAWWEALVGEHVKYETRAEDRAFKDGMVCCYETLHPFLDAALPCVEAMARDTRLRKADEKLLLLSAILKELVEYE